MISNGGIGNEDAKVEHKHGAYGCRKIPVLLHREEGLTLRRTVPRRCRVAVERRERIKPAAPDQVWSLVFMTEQLADGRRFCVLTVVAVYTRESLAIKPGQRLKGEDGGYCSESRGTVVGRKSCSATVAQSSRVRR